MSLPLATPFRHLSALAAVVFLTVVGGTASARSVHHALHGRMHAFHTAHTKAVPTRMDANVGLPTPGTLAVADDTPKTDAPRTDAPIAPQEEVAQSEALMPPVPPVAAPVPAGKKYELKLARQGTGEILTVVYRIGDTYIPDAISKLSNFLHDSHNEEVKNYDPRTFDVLHTVLAKLDRSSSVIEILCGYRTKATNDALRESGTTNAAEHSQHIEAKAIDLRVPGVPANQLRDAALSLEAGGVGYYPNAQFIHLDTGPVRKWVYAPHAARSSRHARRRHRA